MRTMFHDELFEEQECSLVKNLLTDLDARSPDVCSVRFGAVRALLGDNNVNNLKCLLK